MNSLKNKVVVITGASAGVGRALAREFASRGAHIALIARGEKKLLSTQEEVESFGVRGLICPLDVSDEVALEGAAVKIEKELGPIDIWINNAMVTMIGEVKDLSSEEIRRVMDVNYLGSVNGVLVALRRFRGRGKGQIIQIGSALAYLSIPLQSAYCASKHAIHGFLQSLRIELKAEKSSIHVSEAHLPAVNTPQFEWMKNHLKKHPMPVPPIYEPEPIARAVAALAERPRREMWIGASAVKAILGQRFATPFAEWMLAREGISAQQTNIAPPTGISNLWAPADLDMGARGIFSKGARERSFFIWAVSHRSSMFFALSLLIGGISVVKART